MPHILKEETHWLAWEDRAPPDYSLEHELDLLRRRLEDIARHLGDGAKEAMEMDSLRVFAQLCNLDNGDMMTELVGTPHLRFRRLIITIRHTDWWNWEHDEPLGFPTGRWIEAMQSSLPETVTEVCMELESLERKKHQVNAIAEQMRKKWYFQRRDGVSLFADTTLIPVDFSETNKGATETPDGRKVKGEELVHYWSGYSIFNGRRWRRDEKVPGRLDYYVLKVPFRLLRVVEAKGGKVSPEVLHAAETYDISGLYEEISLPNETPLDWSDDDVLLVDESEDEHDEDSIHVEGEEQET